MEIYQNLSLGNLPNEEWKDIVGYEGLYQVSNLGRVKSLQRQSAPFYTKTGQISTYTIKDHISKQSFIRGYLCVQLSIDKEKKMYKVHRLVSNAFIPTPNKFTQINHKDENKWNNCVENLEWCSPSYNNNYGTRNERISKAQINNSTYSKKIYQFTLDGEFIKEWESICEAGRNGYDKKGISDMCNNEKRVKTVNGYLWKFADGKMSIPRYVNTTLVPVFCFDLENNFIKEYKSIKDASIELNVSSGAITTCCQGKRERVNQYKFKYKNGR